MRIKLSPPSAVYIRPWTGPELVQLMACRQLGTKPLPEPMLAYCQLDPWEQNSRKCIWNCRLPKWRPCCPGGEELTYEYNILTWWRHQMETFPALLALCTGNSPVSGEFTARRPVTRSFDIFFDLRMNGRLSKHSWCWWLETPSSPLWRHSNGMIVIPGFSVPHSDQCHNSRFSFPESEFARKQWHLMIRWNGFHWRQSQRRNCWYCFYPKTRNELAEVSHGARCHLGRWNWNRCDRIWRLWNESWRVFQES